MSTEMIDEHILRRNAAEFLLMRRIQVSIGLWLGLCAVVSLLALIVGLYRSDFTALYVLSVVLIIAQSTWMIKMPNPSAFLGLMFCWVVELGWAISTRPSEISASLPLLLVWGIATVATLFFVFRWYRRFAPLRGVQLQRALLKEVADLMNRTMRGEGEDTAQLRVSQNRWWGIGWSGDGILIVGGYGWDSCYGQRSDVRLEDRGKALFGANRKVTVKIGRRGWKGTMPADQWDRLQAWAGTLSHQ